MKTADCGGKRLGDEYGDDVSSERSLEAGSSSGKKYQEQRDENAKTRRRKISQSVFERCYRLKYRLLRAERMSRRRNFRDSEQIFVQVSFFA